MRQIIALSAAALLALSAGGAEARGCLKGAAIGGVAGHFAGHHALAGAAIGCVVGHHYAHRQERRDREWAHHHR